MPKINQKPSLSQFTKALCPEGTSFTKTTVNEEDPMHPLVTEDTYLMNRKERRAYSKRVKGQYKRKEK